MATIRRRTTSAAPAQKTRCRAETEHFKLSLLGERFLYEKGCGIVVREGFDYWPTNKEKVDCLGFKNDASILIEVKTSRADFLADKKKPFRIDPNLGMGDWRFYLSPPNIISPEDLPPGWGLLHIVDGTIIPIVGNVSNFHYKKPFTGNRQAECAVMYSIIRRVGRKTVSQAIYPAPPEESL